MASSRCLYDTLGTFIHVSQRKAKIQTSTYHKSSFSCMQCAVSCSSSLKFVILFFMQTHEKKTCADLILQKSNGQLQRNLSFFKVPEGVQHFPGGGGVQSLIPYRNPYNLWFSREGGGSGPLSPPPLDPHLGDIARQLCLVCLVRFRASSPPRATRVLKQQQHVVVGIFDLKHVREPLPCPFVCS